MLERPEIPIESEEYLRKSAFWAQFAAIVGGIVLAIIVASELRKFTSAMQYSNMGNGDIIGSFLLIAALAVGFLPFYFMFKYASTITSSLKTFDEEIMNQAFGYLCNSFKYIGISTILFIFYYFGNRFMF